MSPITRKGWALIVIAIVVVAAFVGAAWYLTRPAPVRELHVYEWPGYEIEEFHLPFKEKHPDVEIKFTFFGDILEGNTKLVGGFRPDLFHPVTRGVKPLYEAGLLEPIDLDLIPDWEYLDPTLRGYVEEVATYEGEVYWIPTEWGVNSLVYRKDIFEEQGIEEPTSWKILLDPRVKGRTAMDDNPVYSLMIGALLAGDIPHGDICNMNEEQLSRAYEALLPALRNLGDLYTSYAEQLDMLTTGDIWVAFVYGSVYLDLLREGVDVGWVWPEEKALAWEAGFSIIKGAKERGTYELAHDYINAWLDVESQANLINLYGYAPTNVKAIGLGDPLVVKEMRLYEMKEVQEELFRLSVLPENPERYAELWIQAKIEAGT